LGAADQYRQGATLLEEIKKEPGAEHVLERVDLRAMDAEAGHVTAAAAK